VLCVQLPVEFAHLHESRILRAESTKVITEGPETRLSEVGILSLLRRAYLTAGAWWGWRFSIALVPWGMEAGRAQGE